MFTATPSARSLLAVIAAGAIFASGCTSVPSAPPIHQRLDSSTGETVTTLEEPLAFFRDRPMLAANSRDYVYVGPVEVNRSGDKRYMLWAEYCSTIDRFDGPGFGVPERAYLMLDGEPMELVRAIREPEPGGRFYVAPVPGGAGVMYAVTRAQLRAIARAQDVMFVTVPEPGAVTEFGPWRESQSDFAQFSRYLYGDPDSRVALTND